MGNIKIKITEITIPNDFRISYKAGASPYPFDIGYTDYDVIFSGGTTTVDLIGDFNYGEEYWIMGKEVLYPERWMVKNILINDAIAYQLFLQITPTPTPTITTSITSTPSITPTRTPLRSPSPTRTPSVTLSVTPSLTLTPSLTPSMTPSVTPSPVFVTPYAHGKNTNNPSPPAGYTVIFPNVYDNVVSYECDMSPQVQMNLGTDYSFNVVAYAVHSGGNRLIKLSTADIILTVDAVETILQTGAPLDKTGQSFTGTLAGGSTWNMNDIGEVTFRNAVADDSDTMICY